MNNRYICYHYAAPILPAMTTPVIKEKKKRIVTKIGDVFCAEVDGEFKAYFQYVANDLTQLNSSVIRVFKTHYPIDHKPVIEDIVKDEVAFYAHTVLRWGIELNAWYKIGKSTDIDTSVLKKVIFCSAETIKYNFRTHEIKDVNPLENWYIWHIGRKMRHVGKLPKKYHNAAYIGSVMDFMSVLRCIKDGFYPGYYDLYSVLRRQPHPQADIYIKDITDAKNFYYHFRGQRVIEEIIVSAHKIIKLTENKPEEDGEKLYSGHFGNTAWSKDNFITRQEFEESVNRKKIAMPEFKDIVEDWAAKFPLLKKYTPSALAMKAGPLLIVLRLAKIYDDEYRVYLEMLPLWNTDGKITDYPVASFELQRENGAQFYIKYASHERLFEKAVACVHNRFGKVLQPKIRLVNLMQTVDRAAAVSYPPHRPAFWRSICELKLALALYFDSPQMMDYAKSWIEREICFWDEDNFKALYNMSVAQWRDNIYEAFGDRNVFMERISANMARPKIDRLNTAELLCDPASLPMVRETRLSRIALYFAVRYFKFRESFIKLKNRVKA